MKKLLLASAIAALSVSAAHAAPSLYGKAALKTVYTDDTDDMTINDNGSRFGIKGSEAITDSGTNATYKMEFGVHLDVTDSGKAKFKNAAGDDVVVKDNDTIYQRVTYLGMQNDAWGEVRFGNQWTVDAITNEYSDFGGLKGQADSRQQNTLVYIAPSMAGMDVSMSYKLEGDDSQDDGAFALAATYAPDSAPFTLGASYSSPEGTDVENEITLAASYKVMPELTAMVDYRMTDEKASDDSLNSVSVGGVYELNDKQDVYAQMDAMMRGDDDAETAFSAGSNYNFTDKTSTVAWVGYDTESEDYQVGAKFTHNF